MKKAELKVTIQQFATHQLSLQQASQIKGGNGNGTPPPPADPEQDAPPDVVVVDIISL